MKISPKYKINYESEADVISWEVSARPIDYAEEAGNFVVHYSKEHTPVLIEILEASRFLNQSMKIISSKFGHSKILV